MCVCAGGLVRGAGDRCAHRRLQLLEKEAACELGWRTCCWCQSTPAGAARTTASASSSRTTPVVGDEDVLGLVARRPGLAVQLLAHQVLLQQLRTDHIQTHTTANSTASSSQQGGTRLRLSAYSSHTGLQAGGGRDGFTLSVPVPESEGSAGSPKNLSSAAAALLAHLYGEFVHGRHALPCSTVVDVLKHRPLPALALLVVEADLRCQVAHDRCCGGGAACTRGVLLLLLLVRGAAPAAAAGPAGVAVCTDWAGTQQACAS